MSSSLPQRSELCDGLERHFGLGSFRPGQEEVVESVLAGRNTVVVMPTGAGKSLCFQLPAMLLPGTTVVVSPLIALMQDQVDQLTAKGISATFINSTLDDAQRAERHRRLAEGRYKLVYVAPERFRSSAFMNALGPANVQLLAIDEAHCISQWGHDFRPDYAQLGQVRKRLRPPRTVALTATATPEVRSDITRVLLMKDPQVFVSGFDRPNLYLEVQPVSGDDDKAERCTQLADDGGPGIIYCSTRKSAERLHEALCAAKKRAVLYHAGMSDEARKRAQDDFMAAANAVAVATNAFGMGIDKPNIRFVAHANIPRAVEAYYQEIGRAGRDGQPARAVLLFNHADVFTQERLIAGNHPPDQVFEDLWSFLVEQSPCALSQHQLAMRLGASEFELSSALRFFERQGKVRRQSHGAPTYRLALEPRAHTARPQAASAKAVLAYLRETLSPQEPREFFLEDVARRCDLDEADARHAIGLLERAGALAVRRPVTGRSLEVTAGVSFEALRVDLTGVRAQERADHLLLKRMTQYAYAKGCRRAYLLRYFGETHVPTHCQSCDVCGGGGRMAAPRRAPAPSPAVIEGFSQLAAEELRRFRRELAQTLEIPPYLIFNDETLRGLAAALPLDEAEFLRVKGTGPARWERFGPKVVEISLLARAAGEKPRALGLQLRTEARSSRPRATRRSAGPRTP